MILIDQLPVEILLKIFRFLPSYGRVSLVNKLFYDVARSVNDSNICVEFNFHRTMLEDPNHQSIMDSIQNTQRKISKVSISFYGITEPSQYSEWAISDTVKILRKFSATIKFFKLESTSIKMSVFFEFLSLTPNAEHIHLYNVFEQKIQTQCHTMDQPNNECLKLYQLKTLELIECGKEIPVVFNRLPAGILKEFTIGYWNIDFDSLTGFFTQQSNIKKLTLSDEDEHIYRGLPDHIFDHLKLESFECYQSEYNSSHANILSKQTQLASLSLRNGHSDAKINEDVLNVITNQLGELVTLEITVSQALVVPFKRIENLKKLRELTLDSCSLKIIEAFSGLDNSRITTLSLKHVYTFDEDEEDDLDDEIPPLPIHIIVALANSVPNLKVLRFDHDCECPSIVAVMQHFNFVEVLEMKFDERIDVNRLSKTIEVDRCFNPKLTELIIAENFLCDEPMLTKLIAMNPNLKKLEVFPSKPVTISEFRLFLNGFKKMISLELGFRWTFKLTAEYLDCIKNHSNNLKSMTLHSLSEITADQKKELGVVFDVVRYEYSSLYMANEIN